VAITNLPSLPTELVVSILSFPTVQNATRLPRANKESQAIWLKHADRILEIMFMEALPTSAYKNHRLREPPDQPSSPRGLRKTIMKKI
jgi:hypothetical protein